MSFLGFPPEINSGLMYLGPGSAPLMAAATAWDGLSAELTNAAQSVQSVISGLGASWTGASSVRAATATAPYTAWLTSTAAQAAQVGAQAKAAAGLFETAHAAMVPPPVIAANRALLLALISTNFFGQNTPAIAATEAHYLEMWAQDGAGMDTYSHATQALTTMLAKPTAPQQVAAPATEAAKALASDPSSSIQDWLAGLIDGYTNLTPNLTSGLESLGLNSKLAGTVGGLVGGQLGNPASLMNYGSIPARFAMYPISMLMQLARMGSMTGTNAGMLGSNLTGTETLMTSIGQFVDGKLQTAVGTLAGHFSTATSEISAKLAQAASLGGLKVPEAWSQLAQLGQGAAIPKPIEVLPHALVNAPTMSSSSFAGSPFSQALMGALSGRGISGVASKVPKIMPKPTAGG